MNQVLIYNWFVDLAAERRSLPSGFHSRLLQTITGADPSAADRAMREHVQYGVTETLQQIVPQAPIRPTPGSKIMMFGYPHSMKWTFDSATGLKMELPEGLKQASQRPTEHAWGWTIQTVLGLCAGRSVSRAMISLAGVRRKAHVSFFAPEKR